MLKPIGYAIMALIFFALALDRGLTINGVGFLAIGIMNAMFCLQSIGERRKS